MSDNNNVLDKDYKLMIRLRELTPGTYSHSKNVASLLESIGAELELDTDKLVIAGWYHDIGKTVNPKYFCENQEEGESNPHDKYKNDKQASLRFITAHVADTAQILINEKNIPREIIEWCSQHHGTTAVRSVAGNSKKQDDFRYKCSQPTCIESMLLMICDQAEARFTSLTQSDKLPPLKELIDTIFDELIVDQQIEDVRLTLGQVRRIKEILVRELSSRPGKRIEYPADENTDE